MSDIFILDMTISWWASGLRYIFAFLDWVVYGVIQVFFRTIFNLANFELVGFYESFEERIYVILGIFMLFKVTISLLTYLVNPDKITDKEQGMSKVVIRIITVLIMLIALPTAFNLLTEFQNKLLPVIPRVIVGTTTTLDNDSMGEVASDMSTTMIRGFAHKKEECEGQELSGLTDFLTHINDECSESNNTYKYDYLPVVSTVVGVLMVYVLFSLCISTAIRAFKLIILRTIAPVPVISYIDPKSSKNGMFSTWIKTFLSVWAELFVLIGTIYFIVYLIDFLLSGEAWRGFFDGISNPIEGVFLLAFILIGLLFFAKQAPQFVFDALGIKNKGAFTRMLGMGAAALGMGGTVASSLSARNDYDQEHGQQPHRLRNFGASLFNGLASGFNAGNAILSSDKPTLRTGYDAQTKYNAGNLSNIHAGIGMLDRANAGLTSMLFGSTPLDDMEREIANAKANASTAKQLKEYLVGEGKKKTAHMTQRLTFKDESGNEHQIFMSLDRLNELKDHAIATGESIEIDGMQIGANSSIMNKIIGDAEEGAGKLYAEGVASGDLAPDPGALDSFRKTLADSLGVSVEGLKEYKQRDNNGNILLDSDGNEITIDLYNDPTKIKIIEKQNQTKAFRIENSAEYDEAKKIYGKKN